jgi:isopropylmalate/homocitrate/citramalate synthase
LQLHNRPRHRLGFREGEPGHVRLPLLARPSRRPRADADLDALGVFVAQRLLDLGVDEVCFGDTIGVGVPGQVAALTGLAVEAGLSLERIAFHFHDTRGTALANVAAGLDAGIRCFDSSTGGTGGCPYAPGAAGNLATEDLIYFLDASGWESGVSLAGVLAAARFIADTLGRPLASKVGQAGGWDPATGAPIGHG